jgi:hypothetical protein
MVSDEADKARETNQKTVGNRHLRGTRILVPEPDDAHIPREKRG